MPGDHAKGTDTGETDSNETHAREPDSGETTDADTHAEPGDTHADHGDSLVLAREEARQTLDAQLSTFDDIDEKALSIFRLNVAVVSLLVSVLSVGIASGVDAAGLVLTPMTGASVALFVLSAAAAGLTYTAAGQTVGVGPRELRAAVAQSEHEYRRRLVESYADWIRANERTNGRKALLVTLSLLGTVAGVLVLGVGIVGSLTGDLILPTIGTVVSLLVLAVLVDLRGQIHRLLGSPDQGGGTAATESLDESMAGQRTFKGRDRRR